MKKITIYTNETCPYCKIIKEALDNDGGFDVENRLTSEFTEEYRQLSNLLGMGTVPLVVYDGNYLLPARDFRDEKHLVAILNSIIKPEFSFDEMTYQRLITLNYNISVAFNKFEDIIAKIELKMK
jgi:glutaredoxin|tara:strand:+ start:64 stop:438 length:375 start_codon:yes stop_codon:yes gene_type:complete